MLMGSKDEDISQEPITKPVFMEDMSENELATAVSVFCMLKFSCTYI